MSKMDLGLLDTFFVLKGSDYMKKFLKIISIIFIVFGFLFLVSCGSSKSNDSPSKPKEDSDDDTSVVYEPKYLVKFEDEIGNKLYEFEVKSGNSIEMPDYPQKDGYDFDGWYTEDLIKWDSTNKIYKDTILRAKYTLKKISISASSDYGFVLDDHSNDCLSWSRIYEYGETVVMNTTSKLGYKFDGWYSGETCVSEELVYSFVAKNDCSYLAKYSVDESMKIFEFNSTKTTCVITGIKDRNVSNIIIPDFVTGIGSDAFKWCKKISTIIIPNSVEYIGSYAFSGCSSLASITIGTGVTNIDRNAFAQCEKLVEIYNLSSLDIIKGVDDEYGDIAYWAKVVHKSIDEKSIVVIKDEYVFAYYDNKGYLLAYIGNDVNLELPTEFIYDNVAIRKYEIYREAFEEKNKIVSVIIPDNIDIGYRAFYKCCNLARVVLGNVENIDDSAFEYCEKLVEIYNLSSFDIKTGASTYGEIAANAKVIHKSIDENTRIQIIDGYIFYFVKYDNLTYYSAELLGYVGDDKDLVLPSNINYNDNIVPYYGIASSAFYENDYIESVSIPDNVTKIGLEAFYNCQGLKSVILPNGLDVINNRTFYECDNLVEIYIPDSLTTIGTEAFYRCFSLTSITIPDGLVCVRDSAFDGCIKLKFNEYDNAYYLGNEDNPFVILIKAKFSDIQNCIISSNCKVIYSYAFSGCSSLTNIIIPNTVKYIATGAFFGCSSLTNIIIPNEVGTIYTNTFKNCSLLQSIIIPVSIKNIYPAFDGCNSLDKIYYCGTKMQYNDINNWVSFSETSVYYYSETQPTDSGNYWHYVNDEPIIWT